jgi:Fe2+ transport system protein FeoA
VKLSDIPRGAHAVLAEFGNSALHLQLLAMGVNPGTSVRLVRRMPLRGNLYLEIGNRRLVLRHSEAEQLLVAKSV